MTGPKNSFQGVVLAGGQSRRFGEDKALAQIQGRTLLEIAVHLLDGLGLRPVVISSLERDYSWLPCPVHSDLVSGKGPLGGLYTATRLFENQSLVVLSCDMPALDSNTLAALIEAHDPSTKMTVYSVGGQLQPFPGIYESSLSDLILHILEKGELSMRRFIREAGASVARNVDSGDPAFININRKEDLARMARVTRTHSSRNAL